MTDQSIVFTLFLIFTGAALAALVGIKEQYRPGREARLLSEIWGGALAAPDKFPNHAVE